VFSSAGPLARLRIISGIIVLPLIIFIVLVGSALKIADNNRDAEQQRETVIQIQCISAKSDQLMLEALADLERRLGIPVDFTIPEVPVECDGS
jgi:hypothetical protein